MILGSGDRLDRSHLSKRCSLGDSTEEYYDKAKEEGLRAAIEEGKVHVPCDQC
jgi:hypothetical protein